MVGLLNTFLAATAAAGLATTAAQAADDAGKGQSLFVRCMVCHTTQRGAPNRIGPNLFGVVGRKAGSLASYSYSSAMARSGIVWNDTTLERYLMGPSNVVPGTKMTFSGFSNQQQAADVAAYLSTLK